MAGNTFGSKFRVTTFGESHGKAVGVVIDGIRPGMSIDTRVVQREMNRRRPGQSVLTSARNEPDAVEILSGIVDGRTTGTPLCMVIWNKDQRPEAYRKLKDLFRPGHAGYTYLAKYGIADYRGGGRSSGRETASRVAAGAVAKSILSGRGILINAYTKEVGGIKARRIDLKEIERNPLRCPDPEAAKKMGRKISRLMKEGDSIGGIVEIVVRGVPPGLGEPVFDKLEADIAKALMSIGGIRGFEVGNGFAVATVKGSQNNDSIYFDKKQKRVRTRTNNAGGIAGGISNGEDIIVRIAVKPPSSIRKTQRTVSIAGKVRTISVEGRHDPCICPRVVPVAEAMTALTIMDHLMKQQLLRRGRSARQFRDAVDLIDENLLFLVAERRDLARQAREGTKRKEGSIIRDLNSTRRRNWRPLARELGLDPKSIDDIFRLILQAEKAPRKPVYASSRRSHESGDLA